MTSTLLLCVPASTKIEEEKITLKKKLLIMPLPRVADDEPIETNRLHCADQATGHLKVAPGHNSDEKLVSLPKGLQVIILLV